MTNYTVWAVGRRSDTMGDAEYLGINDVDDDGTPTVRRSCINDSEGTVKS